MDVGQSSVATKICGGCLRLGDKAHKCKGCRLTQYCSKECQTFDWNTGGHRKECSFFKKLSETSQRVLIGQPRLRLVGRLFIRTLAEVPWDQAIALGEEEPQLTDDAKAVNKKLEGLPNAAEWWGEGGTLCDEEDAAEYDAMLEASWELFCELYLCNSTFFSEKATRVHFQRLIGIVMANTFETMSIGPDSYSETGFGVYALPLDHACADAHLHCTSDGRSLRLVFSSPEKEEEVLSLVSKGCESELRLYRLPLMRSPAHIRKADRLETLRNLAARRCDCTLCSQGLDCEYTMRLKCGCGQALVYDPQLSGPKVGVCRACDKAATTLTPSVIGHVKSAVARLRTSLTMLDSKQLGEIILPLREDAHRYLHPTQNVLMVQANLVAFYHLILLIADAETMEDVNLGLVSAALAVAEDTWRGLAAFPGLPSLDEACLALRIADLQTKMGAELMSRMWVQRALKVWRRLDETHPAALALGLRFNEIPAVAPPAPLAVAPPAPLADLMHDHDDFLELNVDDPDNILGDAAVHVLAPCKEGA